jgi:tetratricopeptide (TPR) repeat protein
MTKRVPEVLDSEELLHLAVQASRDQRHGDAITYLKNAVAQSRGDFKATYLLAAEYAQIGMSDRAIAGFRDALALKPDLTPARFQLGLLLVTVGRISEAIEAWAKLEQLDVNDPYLYFKRGLEALAGNDLSTCDENLKHGIELNRTNPALNADMQRVLAAARAAGGAEPGGPDARQILLSAYVDASRLKQ